MDDPGTMELLERVGAIERDGKSWMITKAGQAMANALGTTCPMPDDDGINFDYTAWKEKDKAFDHAAYDAKCKAVEDEMFKDGETKATLDGWMAANERIMKGTERPPWKPNARYNKDGDILHVYLCDDSSYVQWLCPGVEVIRAFSDNRIVGFNVWALSHVVANGGAELRKLPDKGDEKFLTIEAFRPPDVELDAPDPVA